MEKKLGDVFCCRRRRRRPAVETVSTNSSFAIRCSNHLSNSQFISSIYRRQRCYLFIGKDVVFKRRDSSVYRQRQSIKVIDKVCSSLLAN